MIHNRAWFWWSLVIMASSVKLLDALVCFSCNQGENPSKCGPGPMSDTTGIKKAKCSSVNATCVTLVNANDNNNTYRDCSDNFWLSKAVIDPLNANTCVLDTYSKKLVCNCQSDLCNTGAVGNLTIYHINECVSNPCQNSGQCRDIYDRYECVCGKNFTGPNCEYCKPGLTGPKCDVFIDMCKPNRCLNGGTCNGGSLDYNCTCLPGFTGYDCEIKIDPCASSPCVNGGVCYANTTLFAYWCDCNGTGFRGPQCATNVNECSELASNGVTTIANCNNGTCVDLIGSYRCDCDAGFSGVNCFVEINECESNPCVKGTCVDKVNEFLCNCFPGYGGVTCADNINECASETCSGHGTCTDLINRYECVCNPGYTGFNCEIDINECMSYPCQNGGTCADEIGMFNCSCKPGYTGKRCEIDIDECSSGPCKNGATCIDQLGKYSCVCTPGYSGVNCTIIVDQCAVQTPCYVGGSLNCTTLVNDFVCSCKQGYTGKTCGTMINYCKPTYCLNGGTCVSTVTGPKCVCDEVYFTGAYCHIPIARCDLIPSPCRNNGTCSGGIGTMPLVCTCPYPFTDATCSTFMTVCQTAVCKNGGSCVEPVPGQFKCSCPNGFSGPDCSSQLVDYCAGVNCNNGVCVSDQVEGTYKCKCEPGFSGKMCDTVSFKCTGPGLFPDPSFCWHYHKCQTVLNGFTKTSYECPKKSLANGTSLQLLFSFYDQICVFPSKFNGTYPNRTCKTTL